MKVLFALLSLVMTAAVHAAPQPLPFVQPPATITQLHAPLSHCAATGFKEGSITGVCQYTYGTQSKYFAYPTALYYVSWSIDLSTSAVLAQCGATDAHHVYTGDGCHVNYNPTGTTVVVDGVTYFYVSTDISGAELVNSTSVGQSYLVD